MSSYPAAALESAAGTTVDINARNKKSVANVSVSAGPHRPAALKTIVPGHRVLAAPMRDIKADWKGLELGGANQCGQHHRDINHRLRIELVEAFAG